MAEILVAPSILSGDFADMKKSVEDIERWGGDWVHCDVMDGVYVPNITFGMPMIASLRKRTNKTLDVHLMITEPENFAERFADSGADIVTFHPDASKDPALCLQKIKEKGIKCGLAFNPNVEIAKYSHLFELCDMILVMTVYAGYGGQKLIPECIDRTAEVKKLLGERKCFLEVDGGVNVENARLLVQKGANVLVAGSSVFKAENPAEVVHFFHETEQ